MCDRDDGADRNVPLIEATFASVRIESNSVRRNLVSVCLLRY
jgi:hypothetical protein